MSKKCDTCLPRKILLSEGSSTNVRETITALGPLGYTIDICDPDPLCMGRFSCYVHKVHQSPRSGDDPVKYLKFVIQLIKENHYDVLLPANEQAYLFSWAKEFFAPIVGLAVADFSAFKCVQTKSAFIRYLDTIGLPHPRTIFATTWDAIQEAIVTLGKPCYVKTDYGTASTGVWRIQNEDDVDSLKRNLDGQMMADMETEFLVQEASRGDFEQLHSIFANGQLLALHCTRRLREGLGGGAIIKVGVDRPIVRRHLEKLGTSLKWHGSMSVDYFFNGETGQPSYIDANPRITEPMNAVVNGINLADMQVRISLGESLQVLPGSTTKNKSHSTIQALLSAAGRRFLRRDVLKEMFLVTTRKGVYKNSQEGVTPVAKDFASILPLTVTFLQLLLNPKSGQAQARKAITNYSLGPAIPRIASMKAGDYLA